MPAALERRPEASSPVTDTAGAASYLGVTERLVRKLRHERRLAAVKVGRCVRYAYADLDAFLAANREGAIR